MIKNSHDEVQDNEEITGLEKAIASSWETLGTEDIESILDRTLCTLVASSDVIQLPFLGEDYILNPLKGTITTSAGKPFQNLFKIGIILHYLVHVQNKPLADKLISFRELWGGNEYFYAFNNRVLKPLVEYFKEKPELLIEAGYALDGEKLEKGEYGIKIPALPRVPVTVLLWTGDDEVSASANVLFDASANEQMETEALVWLSIATVSELKVKAIISK